MPLIPHLIPPTQGAPSSTATGSNSNPYSLYDVAIGGIGFMYASTVDDPNQRQTAPFEKTRIDQEVTPGEQTLTGWWIKSQESFHGGAGQLQLEPPVPTQVTPVRYDLSKNCDVFTPGQVTRLPDTSVISTDSCLQMAGMQVSGADALVWLTTGGAVKIATSVTGTPSINTFTAVSNVRSIATDGARVYAATDTNIQSLDPASLGTSTTIATYPATATAPPRLDWVKARLMLGVNGAVYQVDVSQTGVTLGASQFLYQHPSPGWQWRCFAESPATILAAGDASGVSTITQFAINEVSGAPVLQVDGTNADLPVSERILSMRNVMGTFLVIGTTRGVRIGQFDSYFSRLSYGPLQLLPTDPIIPCNDIVTRNAFAYAVGSAYDEGGLIALDLGTKIDQAGRVAWAPHLIAATKTVTAATCGALLPVSSRIVFCIPGTGVLLEGASAGTGRESWLRTSRIRFDTTEPKLFKMGRVRGDLSSSEILVGGATPDGTSTLATVGFAQTDPPEFRLPPTPSEWLQLTFTLEGATSVFRSYAVKALPGTRRQRLIKAVLALFDNETSRSGQSIRNRLSTRARLNALEQIDASGDEVLYEEFTPDGVISTLCVIDSMTFTQIGRPTRTSDMGGKVAVVLRTVES